MIWVGAALAAPGTERDAWPSLPLEQPVVLSRGWTELTVEVDRAERIDLTGPLVGVHSLATGGVGVRYGVGRHLEISLSDALSFPLSGDLGDRGKVRWTAPVIGGRFGLARLEAPSRSVAVTFGLVPPWVDGPDAKGGPTLRGGIVAAVVQGPVRLTGSADLDLRPLWPDTSFGSLNLGDTLRASGSALLQLGPVAPWVETSLAITGPTHGADRLLLGRPGLSWWSGLGLQVNVTRGVAPYARFDGALLAADVPLLPYQSGRGVELGLRVAM